MKKIGMIGGLSWISTAQYYRRVNEITQDKVGGVTSARIALESVNRQVYVDAVIERGDEETACAQVKQAARDVQAAGADFIVITCNGAHRFMSELQNGIEIPFLHIAQVTADAIKNQGLSRVALLGVRKTMEGSYYQDVLEPMGIETVVPNDEEREFIHDTIYRELTHNRFTQETREGYLRIISNLADRGADCVTLACTEIPLLIPEGLSPISAFSTTELHCQAAVEVALSQGKVLI